jgi:hypothetical protein
MVCAACDGDLPPPETAAPAASSAEPRQPGVSVRMHATALAGADAGPARAAVAAAFGGIGMSVVDDGQGTRDADVLLTVATMPVAVGSAARRTTLTLSTTVGEHELEDISVHYVRSDGAVDPVTVRDLCQRWRRRFQRFQSAVHEAPR